jgi:hypothetical protein
MGGKGTMPLGVSSNAARLCSSPLACRRRCNLPGCGCGAAMARGGGKTTAIVAAMVRPGPLRLLARPCSGARVPKKPPNL